MFTSNPLPALVVEPGGHPAEGDRRVHAGAGRHGEQVQAGSQRHPGCVAGRLQGWSRRQGRPPLQVSTVSRPQFVMLHFLGLCLGWLPRRNVAGRFLCSPSVH